MNALMGDGSVRKVNFSVDPAVWLRLVPATAVNRIPLTKRIYLNIKKELSMRYLTLSLLFVGRKFQPLQSLSQVFAEPN